jgi:hypothetical protein
VINYNTNIRKKKGKIIRLFSSKKLNSSQNEQPKGFIKCFHLKILRSIYKFVPFDHFTRKKYMFRAGNFKFLFIKNKISFFCRK